MSKEECRRFEKKLAFHTAPSLLGIKCASLFTLSRSEFDIGGNARRFNRRAAARGLKIKVLREECSCAGRSLILVYSPKLLAARLSAPENRELLREYGYTDGNAMLPLTKERAMELFMQDVPVFLLYGDNTEAMALDAEDISSHTGVFGVEREEWDAVRGVVTLSEQADTEKLFLENPQDAFLIYQIRRGGELDAYRFMNYDYLQSKGVTPERGGYDAIYTGGFMDYGNARTNLDMIYQRFNVDHPADFKGHSLSVSDIVALKQNGVVSCHYVDSIGFRELPNFLKPENYLKNAEMAMEDDYGMIDGIINNGPKQPTVADLEAQVKAGFSISLTELAAASHREQKKPSVLEKLRERTPEQAKNKTAPKRSAEREL